MPTGNYLVPAYLATLPVILCVPEIGAYSVVVVLEKLFATQCTGQAKLSQHHELCRASGTRVRARSRKAAWLEIGRLYERFSLQAIEFNARSTFINQPTKVCSLRSEMAFIATALGNTLSY